MKWKFNEVRSINQERFVALAQKRKILLQLQDNPYSCCKCRESARIAINKIDDVLNNYDVVVR